MLIEFRNHLKTVIQRPKSFPKNFTKKIKSCYDMGITDLFYVTLIINATE